MNQRELAERWRVSPRTLERWRRKGSGPSFFKLGGRCVYPVAEVEAFENARLRNRAGRAADITPTNAADRLPGRR